MNFHEYANIYRMLNNSELEAMAKNITQHGQLLPITLYEGKILDGRNRYKACLIAGVEPRFEEYTGNDPLGHISALNDHRRHDDPTERAMVGERMASLVRGVNQYNMGGPKGPCSKPAITLKRAAELAGTSKSQIKRVRKAKRDGIPELVDMLESSEITPTDADVVSSLPKEEQRKAVSGGVAGVKAAAKKAAAKDKPIKVPKNKIPTKEEIAQDHNRILANLKTNWIAAPTAIREQFLSWTEKTKISTQA